MIELDMLIKLVIVYPSCYYCWHSYMLFWMNFKKMIESITKKEMNL